MSEANIYLENIAGNTYGIEVEFATHSYPALSFTHIEVCWLHINGGDIKNGWKIETDADYTLELVSPILQFADQANARVFMRQLLQYLEELVRNGIELQTLMERLMGFIRERFIINQEIWVYAVEQPPLIMQITWKTAVDMLQELTWENWDEDTDLEQVLATRRLLQLAIEANPEMATQQLQQQLQRLVLVPSRKHGGLPSSQFNLPLPLINFVYYETYYKRNKAWERLLETETATAAYINRKITQLTNEYPQLAHNNPVWGAKHLNQGYIESQIDEKTPIWHRYWLWLETFHVCAGYLSQEHYEDKHNGQVYLDRVSMVTDSAQYRSVNQAREAMLHLRHQTNVELANVDFEHTLAPAIYYLVVYKLTAGALSELSETLQKLAQQKIMAMEGDMTMEQIKDAIPNNQFMQFHFALKDLTAMWFKAPLFDVLQQEANVAPLYAGLVERIKNKLAAIGPAGITALLNNVLTANLKLLGWYFGVCEANNQEFDYDWEEFCSYNMPSIPAFQQSVQMAAGSMIANFNEPDPAVFATYAQLPQNDVVFLKRHYIQGQDNYMGLTGNIAPWEGRWDTMKRAIAPGLGVPPRYLVEHRNH